MRLGAEILGLGVSGSKVWQLREVCVCGRVISLPRRLLPSLGRCREKYRRRHLVDLGDRPENPDSPKHKVSPPCFGVSRSGCFFPYSKSQQHKRDSERPGWAFPFSVSYGLVTPVTNSCIGWLEGWVVAVV